MHPVIYREEFRSAGIVKAIVAGSISLRSVRRGSEETKRHQCSLRHVAPRDDDVFDANRIARESKPDGGYAGRPSFPRLVFHGVMS